jgi:hypothetical protein
MKILLVYPEFPDTFWSFKHALKICPEEGWLPTTGFVDGGCYATYRVGETVD